MQVVDTKRATVKCTVRGVTVYCDTEIFTYTDNSKELTAFNFRSAADHPDHPLHHSREQLYSQMTTIAQTSISEQQGNSTTG